MDSMILSILVPILGLILAFLIGLYAAFIRRSNRIRDMFNDFITPDVETKRSGLDNLIKNVADNIGHAAFNQVRSMGAASKSAEVRGEKAVDAAISQDLLSQANPVVGALLDSMPGLKKVISRNPALADYALDKILSRAMAGQTGMPNNGSHKVDRSTTLSIT